MNPESFSVNSPVLAAYAARHGLQASSFLADGTMSLIFDGAHRVAVRPCLEGRLVLHAVLMDLTPLTAQRRGEVLARLLRQAAGPARDFAAGLALDGTGTCVLLQQVLSPPIDLRTLETELGDFVNVRVFWQGICSDEAQRFAD